MSEAEVVELALRRVGMLHQKDRSFVTRIVASMLIEVADQIHAIRKDAK